MTAEETNIECARRLGWKLQDFPDHPNGPKRLWVTPEGRALSLGASSALPNFHGSMDAAMMLVARARGWGWSFSLIMTAYLPVPWYAEFGGSKGQLSSENDSPSAAICAAFLKLPLPHQITCNSQGKGEG